MEYARVLVMASVAFAYVFLLARWIGYRQVSQLSLYDYINGITIGSIAAEMSFVESYEEAVAPAIAMFVFALLSVVFSLLGNRSAAARRALEGEPIVLMRGGRLYDGGFRKGRLDINEFQIRCRNSGWFDITQIDTALLEPNGTVSVLPREDARPVTTSDLRLASAQSRLPAVVIGDGHVYAENLRRMGFDEVWLEGELHKQKIQDARAVFLATLTQSGDLSAYPYLGDAPDSAQL